MSGWRWITFSGAKSHAVHRSLEAEIVDDLRSRGCDDLDRKDCDRMSIDVPGMVAVDRPWEEFVLGPCHDPFQVEVPCEDVEMMLNQLSELKPRVTPSGEQWYYKLHGFMCCLVLTPDQREELMELMVHALDGAERRAREFYAGRDTPAVALRKANERATGRSLPEGMFPDRHAHLRDDEDVN